MFCRNCGKEIDDKAYVCPHCGVLTNQAAAKPVVNDSGSAGWGVLGFFFPIVGLILFLIWKDERPKTAKAAGIGALVSAIIYAVLIVIYIILIIIAVAVGVSYGTTMSVPAMLF